MDDTQHTSSFPVLSSCELGTNNSTALLLVASGKNFCLHGGSECRNLNFHSFNPFQTQIGISTRKMDRRITGHLCERNVENKCVPIILTYDQVGEHCHVFMLDFYISKMPQKMEYFYIRP